jgi:post-segregation antitoxin (ccd killing protein)
MAFYAHHDVLKKRPKEKDMRIGTDQVYDADAPKARINMTINADLVRVAREYTDNLSDYVEGLLALAVAEERRKRQDDEQHWKDVCASWNEFHRKHGNIADEYNTDYLPEGYAP